MCVRLVDWWRNNWIEMYATRPINARHRHTFIPLYRMISSFFGKRRKNPSIPFIGVVLLELLLCYCRSSHVHTYTREEKKMCSNFFQLSTRNYILLCILFDFFNYLINESLWFRPKWTHSHTRAIVRWMHIPTTMVVRFTFFGVFPFLLSLSLVLFVYGGKFVD